MKYKTYYEKGSHRRGTHKFHRGGPYSSKERAIEAACRLSKRVRTWVFVANAGTRGLTVAACANGKRKEL
jgi:hypothetical protein